MTGAAPLLVSAVPEAHAAGPSQSRDPQLERLWRAYPLNPKVGRQQVPTIPHAQTGERDRTAPLEAPSAGSRSSWLLPLVLAAGLLGLGAGMALIGATTARVRLEPGGREMTAFFRRILHGPGSAQSEHNAASLNEPRPSALEEPHAAGKQTADAALTSLEHAIEATLREARQQSEGLRQEAEQMRREAEVWSQQVREDAEAYALSKRQHADELAASIVAEAEERTRRLQRDLLRTMNERRSALAAEVRSAEERLHRLLAVFHSVAERSEHILRDLPEVDAAPPPSATETPREALTAAAAATEAPRSEIDQGRSRLE